MQLILGIASALSHAHARHVVHSDFKPGNVLVTPEGNAKVIDFGQAQDVSPSETGDYAEAKVGAVAPYYMMAYTPE